MTNGWVDIKNTDMMLIMGGNPAENHPCGFKWPIEAKRTRNAKMIVVDPRFTRTASVADLFCQIRAGSDIAFLGGVIRYAIENNRIAKDYLLNYTNAAFIVKSDFKLPGDTGGVFSGFDAKSLSYDKATWNYEGEGPHATAGGKHDEGPKKNVQAGPPAPPPLPEKVHIDLTLQNPQCVFQLLRKHYSRYTPEMVERITGIPQAQFLKAADLFTSVSKATPRKSLPSFTPLGGPSTPTVRRSSARQRCCNSFWGMLGGPAAASMLFADTPTFKAQRIWPESSIICPAI
jgi:formate dehydrogenase major subunit